VLVGHSLGGLLGLMLAERDPAALRSLVLLDSPLVAGWRAALLWGGKRSGLAWRVAPAAAARRRRERWPDLDAVREHFAAKPVFARWDPEMLADYAANATEASDGQRVLRFRRDVEARIYATLPHGLGRLLRRPPPLPIGFIGGTASRELQLAGTAATRRLVGEHLRWIDGTHLFPFEQPQRTAELIEQLWAELEAGRQDPSDDVAGGARNTSGCSL
jgi:pimeloyl-ACP methyl ester carboxylesterase